MLGRRPTNNTRHPRTPTPTHLCCSAHGAMGRPAHPHTHTPTHSHTHPHIHGAREDARPCATAAAHGHLEKGRGAPSRPRAGAEVTWRLGGASRSRRGAGRRPVRAGCADVPQWGSGTYGRCPDFERLFFCFTAAFRQWRTLRVGALAIDPGYLIAGVYGQSGYLRFAYRAPLASDVAGVPWFF